MAVIGPRRSASAASTALSRPPDSKTAVDLYSDDMYLVTKRIEFCYGHRLLDYDGICKHPHGHNASVEIDVRTDSLDNRNMVVDFSDIKRIVKGWIDRELDHKMILRHDDPLVEPLRKLGEPMYLLESNPTVERIAKLIFDHGRELGVNIQAVRVWETPTSVATYSLAEG
jgi:6-pyruvoyltetrahydropterin/6-carboxytetrahydropterin synthase